MHRVVGNYVIAMHAFSLAITIHSIVNIYKIELLKMMSLSSHNLEIIKM